MEYLLGGVLFALFIAAQALALVAIRPVSLPKSQQSEWKPAGLSTRGRRLLQL
jgi:hypothetical protein